MLSKFSDPFASSTPEWMPPRTGTSMAAPNEQRNERSWFKTWHSFKKSRIVPDKMNQKPPKLSLSVLCHSTLGFFWGFGKGSPTMQASQSAHCNGRFSPETHWDRRLWLEKSNSISESQEAKAKWEAWNAFFVKVKQWRIQYIQCYDWDSKDSLHRTGASSEWEERPKRENVNFTSRIHV